MFPLPGLLARAVVGPGAARSAGSRHHRILARCSASRRSWLRLTISRLMEDSQ